MAYPNRPCGGTQASCLAADLADRFTEDSGYAPVRCIRVRLEQGDTGDGKVARADVAEVVAHALTHPEARGKTFELYGEPASRPPTGRRCSPGCGSGRSGYI